MVSFLGVPEFLASDTVIVISYARVVTESILAVA